ncbi:DNA topoisomerase 1 [Phtheirospermum japonicum]|uniref:DNA topoisomerase 1 n=1 Tax=Phtheirospermum japonicum TaxID=374723 RepID=A0A830C8B1_9LAMI|nr:DNA topoisomerase 1 [Phtheirospermum japonicum]
MECDEETKVGPRNLTRNISRLSYLDPRITFAWCKRNEVPIEKIFNKSLMAKFGWASDVDPGFRY